MGWEGWILNAFSLLTESLGKSAQAGKTSKVQKSLEIHQKMASPEPWKIGLELPGPFLCLSRGQGELKLMESFLEEGHRAMVLPTG